MNRATKDQPRAVARFLPVTNAAHRGMVTFELAIGLLAACLATALLGWGIGLVLHAYSVFVQKPISEADIEREMHRHGSA